MSLATELLTDVVGFIDGGINGGQQVVGTVTGTPYEMGGGAPFRKLGFILKVSWLGTTSTTVTLAIKASATSGGTYSTFTSSATGASSSQSITAGAAGAFILYMELRGECLTDLGIGPWIEPVITVAGATANVDLIILGLQSGSKPASNFNSSTLGGVTTVLLM